MGKMGRLAEIGGAAFEPGGDHVPAGPSAADVIQRSELARHVEGFAVTDGQRGDEPDVRCRPGKCGKDGKRLEAVKIMRAGFFGDEDAVGQQEEIKLRRLSKLCLSLIVRKAGACVGLGIRVTPISPSHSDSVEHESKLRFTVIRHGKLPDHFVPAQEWASHVGQNHEKLKTINLVE